MQADVVIVPEEVKNYFVHRNAAGGRAYFIPRPDPRILRAVLREADPVPDVAIAGEPLWPLVRGPAYAGALTYLHKVKAGRDIYLFANTTDQPAEVNVALRGEKHLEVWDPHTGERRAAASTVGSADGGPITAVHLVLPPVRGTFLVGE